jgi:hypothetical protein
VSYLDRAGIWRTYLLFSQLVVFWHTGLIVPTAAI